jgi:diguanylate cyclase (GGDEF)-like protein
MALARTSIEDLSSAGATPTGSSELRSATPGRLLGEDRSASTFQRYWAETVEFFADRKATPEFRRAQFVALSGQAPLLYIMLTINMLALAFLNFGTAPNWLTVTIPAVIAAIFVGRSAQMIAHRQSALATGEIESRLRTTLVLSLILCPVVSAWALALFQYGDAHAKGQVAFFVGVTVVAVITCLMPLRQVAIITLGLIVVPAAVFLFRQDEIEFQAISINMLLVFAAMALVLLRSHSDFRERIAKETELETQRHELQKLNARVVHLANEDALTGLPNRRSLFDRLDLMIGQHTLAGGDFVLGLIDLDGFKPVNDVFGHSVGDKLLREVGRRLSKAMPAGATLARLGGDEFAFLVTTPGSDSDVREMCERILAPLALPIEFKEGSATVSGTCGVARFDSTAISGLDLFDRADFSLYYAKQKNRGMIAIYSKEHETAIKHTATISQTLREADLEAELTLAFQPIMSGIDARPSGYEALARWNSPVLGPVAPDVFIRAAEQCGIVSRVTLVLFRKALAIASEWPDDVYLSFNLSAQDICSPSTLAEMQAALARSSFPAQRLVLEITESAVMQDFDRALFALDSFREFGAKIALDDFGSGYSSLGYVKRLPIERIKVDRAFVMDIEKDKSARDIMKTIADLCRNLGLDCIVEGVETEAQLRILAAAGCTGYQGYLFARPMSAHEVLRHIATTSNLAESA